MSCGGGGGGAAGPPARKVIEWFDLVTLNVEGGRHGHGHRYEQCGVVVRRVAGNKLGVRRADGTLFAAGSRDLRVLDRSHLCRGVVVALESDPGGHKIGVVTGASTALDLVRFEEDEQGRRARRPQAVAVAVSPDHQSDHQELRRVTELVVGEYVVSGAWLGRVVEVSLDADVVFDDGALCRLGAGAERKLVGAGAEEDEYDDLWIGRQANSVLYPGQRVSSSPSSVLRQEARWIRGYWKPSRVRGTVSRVGVAGVLVRWVASRHRLDISKAPSAWQSDQRKLARFPCPTVEASPWLVGDRCFFRTPRRTCHDHDHAAGSGTGVDGDHGRRLTRRHRHWNRRQSPAESSPLVERPMSVAGTRTTVDVLWQDGTRQRGLPSRSLVLFRGRNAYDFFPGQHVVSSRASAAAGEQEQRSGIVRSLNCEDKTVLVSWFKPATTSTTTCPGPAAAGDGGAASSTAMEEGETAVMSVYDLACDHDASFFYGDVVLRLQQHPNPPTETTTIAAEVEVADDLSWVGHDVHLCCEDGRVQVKWGDGSTSKVLPHEIALVKKQRVSWILWEIGDWLYEDDDIGQEDATSSSSAAAAAAVAHHQAQPEEVAIAGPAFPLTTTTTMDRVRSAARALIRLAGDLFAHGKRFLPAAAVAEESAAASPEPAAAMEVDVAVEEAATPMPRVDSDGSTSTSVVKTSGDEPFQFLRFDVVQSPPDHHFLDSIEQATAVRRKWTKRVQKEWEILDKGMPDTIYVRAYEDRTDLLRVAMVGASGTPYHDGLFFFDLHLPPTYPAEPPMVNYRSFGLWVNPNLYPSGTVCLSLLNTFGGQGSEVWSPEASTILQVLVSIQGLVLTAQPYYNEYARRNQAGTQTGRRNELPCREHTYLLNLQTMLHLLRRPPSGFEEFVRDHFRRRGRRVIRACEAYLDAGCLVGTLDDEGRHPTAKGSREQQRSSCSAGFRLALLNVLPRLVEAFANCHE